MLNSRQFWFNLFWLLIGIGILLYLQSLDKAFFKKSLLKKINHLSLNSKSFSEFESQLPKIFKEDKDLMAIIVKDEGNRVRSSLYDSNRISLEKYNQILENYSSPSFGDAFFDKNENMVDYETIFQERVHLYFEKLGGIFSVIGIFESFSIADWFWAVLYLGIGALLSLIIFDIDSIPIVKLASMKSTKTTVSKEGSHKYSSNEIIQPKISNSEIDRILGSRFGKFGGQGLDKLYIRRSYIFENQLKSIMNRISKIVKCRKITFFFSEDDKWESYLQKQGKIFIKGSFIDKIPKVVEDLEKVQNSVVKTKSSIVMSVNAKKEAVGAFYLEFFNVNLPSEDEQEEVLKLIAKTAAPVATQRKFENAAIDPETSFYTFPYFYITLNDKMVSHAPFITLVFRIRNIDQISSYTLKSWSRGIIYKMQLFFDEDRSKGHINMVARTNQETFVILIETQQKNIDHLSQAAQELENFSANTGGIPVDVCSTIVPRLSRVKDTEGYLKIMEQQIWIASEEKAHQKIA